ncbi:HlyD family secretion protein [Citrobacter portucalensis]|uniref:HlyD family secretion protein n=1 Tax=Citrobacter portucalensis TaxID=1639133 RepID=UPI00243366A2|nr:HlyD family secretion protein [Citrobacter portucalensis]WFZ28703.1 HlyD family secretion protein [Citrobacter portucalensis]WFZ33703.1 HlyD family secretion protein [Citrobacter portucalensis]
MMTPEQKFARWVRVSIAAFLVIFAWFIVADIWIPLTPDSTVMRVVTPVSSRVSGYVSQVHVHNNSQVKKGDLLYELDPTPFINKVEAAQIALEQAKLSNQQLDAQIVSARANLRTAQFNARNDKTTLDRYQSLSAMQNVSQSDLDKVRTAWQTSEQSVAALNASIQNLLIQRGERDDKRNVTLQKYRNTLEEAQLNLGWSKVYAQTDGTVSNLQLSPGLYATAATPLLALVSHQTDIVADFREKSLRHTRVNTDAAVVFDAMPGKVFSARVTSSDAGILAGQEQVNGQLSQPEQSTRWVRDAQRMRIHVALNEPLDTPLPTGARATVQLYNSEGMFARTFAGAQIHLVSWLHYVY